MAAYAIRAFNGKLPDLETVLTGGRKSQSVEQQRSMLRMLSQRYKRPMMRGGKQVVH